MTDYDYVDDKNEGETINHELRNFAKSSTNLQAAQLEHVVAAKRQSRVGFKETIRLGDKDDVDSVQHYDISVIEDD